MMEAFLDRLELRQLRLLLAGALLLVLSLAGVYAVMPGVKAYRANAASIENLERNAPDDGMLARQLEDTAREIDDLRRRLHGDMANLPIKQVESFVIGKLQRISWENRVELTGVQPAAGEKVQVFREMLFNVRLAGEYKQLFHWLWQARNELGFVVIKELRMQRTDARDENPVLVAQVTLASYRAER